MDLINESVHTADNADIGDIHTVSRDFIVVKRGFMNVHYYYIPISQVEGWDGHVVWLKVKEDEVKAKYTRKADLDYSSPSVSPHYNNIELPRLYKCSQCNTMFKTEDELTSHMEYHY